MIAFFANLFGYLLNFLYELVGNFGLAIILFSVLIKILMIPISIKQQKTMKKSQKINDEMKQIQFKYKNDPEKMNQEVMSLYKRENMSPFSGCFSAIIQLILLFAVLYLVRSPLTYMRKIDPNVIEQLESIVQENGSTSNYKEIAVINYINNIKNGVSVEENNKTNQDDEQAVEENSNIENNNTQSIENNTENLEENSEKDNVENIEENTNNEENNVQNVEADKKSDFNINDYIDVASVNMEFLGLDLSKIPVDDLTDLKALIIPVLYVISSFISIRLSTKTTTNKDDKKNKLIGDGENKKQTDEYDPMQEANKSMSLFMPIMTVSIACIAPLGLALYWLINNVLMILERFILDRFLKERNEEEATKNA